MSLFLDTNILLYAMMEEGTEKAGIADSLLLHQDCHISVQTLNEATNTLRRKTKLPLDDIKTLITDFRGLVTIHPITEAVYSRGWAIIERYGLQTYDAMILACAMENGIETLLSEDMQNGQRIFDMMTIINPFQQPAD
ncbi:PIN domain-containing protein [Acetobacter syzygii]|uniref:PIN domain-containing protein n=1 Tax=Acetobacter syzygii TaxID=146476 RepID=UPI0039EA9E67